MTARQLYENVLIELNKVKAPSLSLSDFIYIANKSIYSYINEIYNSFDINQQRLDDLSSLRCLTQLVEFTGNKKIPIDPFDVQSWRLPKDYLHMLNVYASYEINDRCIDSKKIIGFPVSRLPSKAEFNILNNAYFKPSNKRMYYTIGTVSQQISQKLTPSLEDDEPSNLFQNSNFVLTKEDKDVHDIEYPKYRLYINEGDVLVKQKIVLKLRHLLEDPYDKDEKDLEININLDVGGENNLINVYRTLLKVINQNEGLNFLSVDMIDDYNLELTTYGYKYNIIEQPKETDDETQKDSIKIKRIDNTDFLTENKSYKRISSNQEMNLQLYYKYLPSQAVITIDYIRSPQRIELSQEQLDDIEDNSQILEFQEYVLNEIINKIVLLILENNGNPRIQTNPAINQTIPIK